MSKTDDGQYELILGDRQLVSGFFVLIILFAIFLTLGYVLGRNSVVVTETPETAGTRPAEDAGPRPPVGGAVANVGKPSASEPAPAEATQPEQAPRPAAEPPPAPVTTAAQVAERTTTAPAAAAPKPQPETAKAPAAVPSPVASKAQEILNSRVRLITPRKGDTFVQVAAIARPEAELMAEQLQRRGYRAFITEVPGKDLFRVLVGPFETPAKLAETKAKLAGDGIESIVQRY